jgi:ketosteroid isomerase-like protein
MKSIVCAVVWCVSLAGIAGAQSPHGLQPVLDDLLPAANAHDTDRFLASYLHDSTIVFVFNGVAATGFATIRTLQLAAWAKTDVVYSQRGPMTVVALSPDVAVVTDLLSARRTLPTGEVKTGDLTVSMVCQKRPEGWRIVYVHESTVR